MTTLRFFRNKLIEVEPQAEGKLSVSWRLTDDLQKTEVDLIVQTPEMEIVEAKATMERLNPTGCQSPGELIKKIEGIAIGSGLRKIVQGLVGSAEGCSILVDAVLESSNAVILHFTRPGIEAGEKVPDSEKSNERYHAMLKASPRLVRSCVSFQDDSPIMQGFEY